MAATASSSKLNGGGADASGSTAAPSPTLYVKNIESKVKKPELRRQLYSLFSTYGRVLDVVATRAPGMRGQAFIVFESATISSAAKRALAGFSFYGKALHIDYATGGKSKALLRRELGHDAVHEMELEQSKTTVSRRGEKRSFLHDHLDSNGQPESLRDSDGAGAESESDSDPAGGGESRKRIKLQPDTSEAPGVIVQALNLPNSIEPEVIAALFSRKDGYLSVIQLPTTDSRSASTWTAAIKFDSHPNAHAAKDALNGIQIDPTYNLDLHLAPS